MVYIIFQTATIQKKFKQYKTLLNEKEDITRLKSSYFIALKRLFVKSGVLLMVFNECFAEEVSFV